jgi:AraC-like DNA-binding protein
MVRRLSELSRKLLVSMKPVDPLSPFPLLATDCVEEAESILSQSLTRCHIKKVADRRQFSVQMNGLEFGRASLVYNRYGTESQVETELPGEPVFFIVGSGEPSTFRFGGRTAGTHAETPVMVADAHRMEIDRPEDSGMVVLRVWSSDLEHHLEALTDRHHRGRLEFDPEARLDEGAGASLARLIQFLVEEMEQDAPVAKNPVFRRCYEDLLLNALLALPHNRHGILFEERAHEYSPGLVTRAEEYMRANLGEPVTVSDLVQLCECSRSTLFAAFRNAKGYSPMEFLTEERLQAARRDLMSPGEITSVSSTALECGFVHLGRFARAYRDRFGEAPSRTLRSRR